MNDDSISRNRDESITDPRPPHFSPSKEKIYITCPECKKRLCFLYVPGYKDMLVECPICHFKANTSVYLRLEKPKPRSPRIDSTPTLPTQIIYSPTFFNLVLSDKQTTSYQLIQEGMKIPGDKDQRMVDFVNHCIKMGKDKEPVTVDDVIKLLSDIVNSLKVGSPGNYKEEEALGFKDPLFDHSPILQRQYEELLSKISDLEKENAELKEKIRKNDK